MGGALAVHTALLNASSYDDAEQNAAIQGRSNNGIQNLVGICVIDVVEGTAMEALSSMQSFLRSRPKSFPTIGNNCKLLKTRTRIGIKPLHESLEIFGPPFYLICRICY